MATIDQIRRALRKLGRQREDGQYVEGSLVREEKSKHTFYEYWYCGKEVWRFGIPRGSKARLRPLRYVPTQMKLSKPEFIELAACPMSKRKCNELLRARGAILSCSSRPKDA